MRAKVIDIPITTGGVVLDNASGRLLLTNLQESNNAAATVIIYDGSSAAGPKLVTVKLAANGVFYERHGSWLLPYKVGLYLDVVTGHVEGSVSVFNCPPDHPVGDPVIIVGQLELGVVNLVGGK